MKSEMFIARLAGAAATATTGLVVPPSHDTAMSICPQPAQELVCPDSVNLPEDGVHHSAEESVVLTVGQQPSKWDKKMEREFRALALEEAKGSLPNSGMERLEELTRWRNLLMHGLGTEDILLQLKRDRLLGRMESLLKQYVQFYDATDQKRSSA